MLADKRLAYGAGMPDQRLEKKSIFTSKQGTGRHLELKGAQGACDKDTQVLLRHQHLVLRRRPLRRHMAEQLRQRLQPATLECKP